MENNVDTEILYGGLNHTNNDLIYFKNGTLNDEFQIGDYAICEIYSLNASDYKGYELVRIISKIEVEIKKMYKYHSRGYEPHLDRLIGKVDIEELLSSNVKEQEIQEILPL